VVRAQTERAQASKTTSAIPLECLLDCAEEPRVDLHDRVDLRGADVTVSARFLYERKVIGACVQQVRAVRVDEGVALHRLEARSVIEQGVGFLRCRGLGRRLGQPAIAYVLDSGTRYRAQVLETHCGTRCRPMHRIPISDAIAHATFEGFGRTAGSTTSL
jgi:hypothetical protein